MSKILSIVANVVFIAGAGYGVFLVHQAEKFIGGWIYFW